jgi:putative phage-type endonuclease
MTTPVLNATLVTEAAPGSDEWLNARYDGITATDIPKIIGVTKWGNPRSVWEAKVNRVETDAVGEPAVWGTLLEPVVADEWARREGVTIHGVGILAHREHPWRMASLDRLVTGCQHANGGICALEVKTRSAYTVDDWDPDRTRLPEDVEAQVVWQMHVTGVPHVHVAVLIGGQRFVQVTVHRDLEVEELVVKRAVEFWQNVQRRILPDVTYDETALRVLNGLFPDRSGEVSVPAADADRLLDEWRQATADAAAARAAVKAAEARRTAIKAEMTDLLGGADTATVEGRETPVWTAKRGIRRGFKVNA